MREGREIPNVMTYVCYGLLPCDRAQRNLTLADTPFLPQRWTYMFLTS